MKDFLEKIKEQKEYVTVYFSREDPLLFSRGTIEDFDDKGIVIDGWRAFEVIPWNCVYKIDIMKDQDKKLKTEEGVLF